MTTVRDLSAFIKDDDGNLFSTLRDSFNKDENNARLISVGVFMTVPNGYPTVFTGDFELGMPMKEINSMSEAGMTPMQKIKSNMKHFMVKYFLRHQNTMTILRKILKFSMLLIHL